MSHGKNPGWESGNHWVVCDVCGFDYRHSVMRLRWDGLVVCPDDWELRHPQDFIRGVPDDFAAKGLVRPPPKDVFIQTVCNETKRQGIAGIAVAGCAIAGNEIGNNIPEGTFGS